MSYQHYQSASATVTALSDVGIFEVQGCERLAIDIAVATAALTGFVVQGKVHPNSAFVNYFSAAADYTSPAGLVVDASGDLTTLGVGNTGWLVLLVDGLHSVKIRASSAGSATVTLLAAAGGR